MIYKTIDTMWYGALCRTLNGESVSPRGMPCREIRSYQATLLTTDYNFLMNPRRRLSPVYASAELLWYLSRSDSTEMIEAYAPQYAKFAEKGIAHGAYGKRMQTYIGQDQFIDALELLGNEPDTRQCIITLWYPHDLMYSKFGGKKDIPCTLTWQFMVRNGTLHMICTMRSNDIWLGFPYDVYVNTTIQQLMASALNLDVGTYTHQVGSLHVYEKNVKAARETASFATSKLMRSSFQRIDDLERQTAVAVRAELRTRTIGYHNEPGLCDILNDTVLLCESKWGKIETRKIKSRLLRKAYQCSLLKERTT